LLFDTVALTTASDQFLAFDYIGPVSGTLSLSIYRFEGEVNRDGSPIAAPEDKEHLVGSLENIEFNKNSCNY
jgi:hypothetical protein